MNYLKLWEEKEGKYKDKNKLDEKVILDEFRSYIKNKYGEVDDSVITKDLSLNFLVCFFSIYNKDIQDYILRNIINKINREDLMCTYMQLLTLYSSKKDSDAIDIIIKSFIKTGYIDNITYDDVEEVFTITIDYVSYRFSYYTNNSKLINEYAKKCHEACETIINKSVDKNNLYALVVKMKFFNNTPLYHSLLVKDNYVSDPARNIIMSFEFFNDVLKPEILVYESAIDILKNKENIENEPYDNTAPLLKYALYKEGNR